MATTQVSIIKFGAYEFDVASRQLSKLGFRVKLSGQPVEILAMLLERHGEVVTREQIRTTLWTGTYVDYEHSLNAAVTKLRDALCDSSNEPRFIETVPRRGYRFIAPIEERTPVPELHALEVRTPPAGLPSWRRVVWSTVGILFGLAIVVLIFSAGRHRNTVSAPSSLHPLQLTSSGALPLYPTYSPDGSEIAYCIDRGSGYEIYVREVSIDGRERQLTSDGQDNIQPSWSPDGKTILFHSRARGGIWQISPLGGAPRVLVLTGARPAWSPDGTWIAYQSGPVSDVGADATGPIAASSIWLVRSDGSNAHSITEGHGIEGGHGNPAWSHDGRHIAFTSTLFSGTRLWIFDLDTNRVHPIQTEAVAFYDPVFTPDGNILVGGKENFYSGFALWKIPLNRKTAEPNGDRIQLLPATSRIKSLALSRDGSELLYSSVELHSALESTSVDPGHPSTSILLSSTACRTASPNFSPDGRFISVQSCHTEGHSQIAQLSILRTDGGDADTLPSDCSGAWTPDSRSIIFSHADANALRIYKIDIETKQRSQLLTLPPDLSVLSLSPDARTMAFNRSMNGATNTWLVDIASQRLHQLTFDSKMMAFAAWSPHGDLLVFEQQTGSSTQLVITSKDSGKILRQLTADAGEHWTGSWTPDGKNIVYVARHQGVWNLFRVSTDGGPEIPITRFSDRSMYLRFPKVSPTGERAIYEKTSTSGELWKVTLVERTVQK